MLPPLLRKMNSLQLAVVDVTTAAIRNSSAAFLARISRGGDIGNVGTDIDEALSKIAALEQRLSAIAVGGSIDSAGNTVTPVTIIPEGGEIPEGTGLVLEVEDVEDIPSGSDEGFTLYSSGVNSSGNLVVPITMSGAETEMVITLGTGVSTNIDTASAIPIHIINSNSTGPSSSTMSLELEDRI